MPGPEPPDLFVRMRAAIAAAVTGLSSGRLYEQTLASICEVLGATSAWATLASGGSGKLIAADAHAGARPSSKAEQRAEETTKAVLRSRRPSSGRLPNGGSFVALPFWSTTVATRTDRRLVGALYVEFRQESVPEPMEAFLESTASLLGGITAQQARVADTEESLRAERAKDPGEQHLSMDELLDLESMQPIRREVYAAMRGDASIMILGESGTGKTQLAVAIARVSTKGPVVRATLGFSDDLNTITSELFGHERGAFSGAMSKRKGLVEYADGGTLILDEVLNLPPHAQQLLLDFTQFGTYRPLGYEGGEPKRAKLRLIAVTNGNIAQAIADTRFRQDLYFRLATVPLTLPPLRQRRREIPELAVRYLRRKDPERPWSLDGASKALLLQPNVEWAGNIRELEAVMERAKNRLLADEQDQVVIRARHLDLPASGESICPSVPEGNKPRTPESNNGVRGRWDKLAERREDLDLLERQIIEDALAMCGGVVAETARELSVSRTGLISRMVTLDVDSGNNKSENRR